MTANFRDLPNLLVIGALVAIFFSLQTHNRTPRLRLWLFGWCLIFAHFAVSLVDFTDGPLQSLQITLQLSTLAVAGMSFLVSMTSLVTSDRMRERVLFAIGAPVVLYAALLAWDINSRFAYSAIAAALTLGGATWLVLWHRKLNTYVAVHSAFLLSLGAMAVVKIWERNFEAGFYSLLLGIYAMSALLFVRRYPRFSPGVVLTAGGFLSWATVFGLASFATDWVFRVGSESSLWNVPKYFVGFGMIVTLLEDQYLNARAAERRERMLNVQMARFGDLTSKLLGGVEAKSLCGEIAAVINEVANFRRVAISILGENNRMFLAGQAGIEPDVLPHLEQAISRLTIEDIQMVCARGRKIGQVSYIYPQEVAESVGSAISTRVYFPNAYWNTGDELLVPIRTAQQNIVGCISLDDPKNVKRVTSEEISKIEMLANDIGVAIEKNTLQRKIVLHEKLASVGQLVSGVAHELNNPLTAVLGYAELMSDADTEARFKREIEVIRREGRRMKTIIDNLLRFARQSRTETRAASLAQALQEALVLREYDINRSGAVVEKMVQPGLPYVACDEAQLKTVLVHLLNNALDAVREAPEKRIQIEARRIGERVVLSFCDSGPGFQDITRIFDPFFTTKGVGRGTGLGLSICYGIVKQHGGDIHASNMPPTGACVTIELPAATELVGASLTSATAN